MAHGMKHLKRIVIEEKNKRREKKGKKKRQTKVKKREGEEKKQRGVTANPRLPSKSRSLNIFGKCKQMRDIANN